MINGVLQHRVIVARGRDYGWFDLCKHMNRDGFGFCQLPQCSGGPK